MGRASGDAGEPGTGMTSRDTNEASSWRSNVAGLAVVVVGIVAVDQATKVLVTASLVLGQSVPVVSGLVHFTLVRNTGMAFGLLSGSDIPYKTVVMTLLAVGAMGAVTYYALRTSPRERLSRIGLALILGGALGNIIDRVRLGFVVDFIDVFYRDAHWPAFNVADTCICIGVGLLILDSFRHHKPELATEAAASGGRGER